MNPQPAEEPPDRLDLALHLPAELQELLPPREVRRWVELPLSELARPDCPAALGIAVITPHQSRRLNQRYRQQDKPTNVLSFPLQEKDECGRLLLGDLLLCAEVIQEESSRFGIPWPEHFAHLVVHGLLHLLGYDHQEAAAARVMENLESRLLCRLGFADPWQERAGSSVSS